MVKHFDPYHKWLGITPDEQPADYYRLLGVNRFEPDGDAIASAADQRLIHLRGLRTGEHAPVAERILSELTAARACLLDPQKKAAYDAQLRQWLSTKAAAAPQPTAEGPGGISVAAPETAAPRREQAIPFWPTAAAAAAVVVLISLMLMAFGGGEAPPVQRAAKSESPGDRLARKPAGEASAEANRPSSSPSPAPGAGSEGSKASEPESENRSAAPGQNEPATVELSKADDPLAGSEERAAEAASADEPAAAAIGDVPRDSTPDMPPANTDADGASPSAEPAESAPPVAGDAEVASAQAMPAPDDSQAEASQPFVAESADPAEPPESPQRLPVPEAAEIEAAVDTFQSVFRKELAEADAPAEQAELAERWLKLSLESENEPAELYVLLRRAASFAGQAGRGDLMRRAVAALTERFQVERWPTQVEAFAEAMDQAPPGEARKALISNSLAAADEAVGDEALDAAERLLELAIETARKRRDTDQIRAIVARSRELESLQEVFEAADAAARTLAEDPDDPAASTVRGRYLLVHRHDWPAGLRLLAQGDDAQLADAAMADLAAPEQPAAQGEVADAWYDLAHERSKPAASAYAARAVWWYQKAAPELEGIARAKAQKRLAAMEIPRAYRIPPDIGLEDPTSIPVGEVRTYAYGGGLLDAAITPDGRSFFATGWGGRVVWYETASGTLLMNDTKKGGVCYGIAVSPDGRRVVCGGRPGDVNVFDIGEKTWDAFKDGPWLFEPVFFSDSRRLLYGTASGARVYDLDKEKLILKLGGSQHWIQGIDMAENERLVFAAGFDKTARVLDAVTGRVVRRFEGGLNYLRHAAVSPDGRLGAASGDDGKTGVWDLQAGERLHTFDGGRPLFIEGGRYLINKAKKLQIWDPTSGALLATCDTQGSCMAVFPDERFVLIGAGGKIGLWRLPLSASGRVFKGKYEPGAAPTGAGDAAQ
jgi:hypothetical protein